jgi:hypothetical protein
MLVVRLLLSSSSKQKQLKKLGQRKSRYRMYKQIIKVSLSKLFNKVKVSFNVCLNQFTRFILSPVKVLEIHRQITESVLSFKRAHLIRAHENFDFLIESRNAKQSSSDDFEIQKAEDKQLSFQ